VLFFKVTANNTNAKEKQKKYYKLKKTKGFKTYKFHIGQAVMKANPKKLGGRKCDRMTPDWLDGYDVVSLTSHQVVLRNTKTNKVLKSISLAHIKPFLERCVGGEDAGVNNEGVGSKVVDGEVFGDNEAVGDEVVSVGDEVVGDIEAAGDEIVGDEVVDDIEAVGGEVVSVGNEVVGDIEAVGDEVGDEVVGGEVASVGNEVLGDEAGAGDKVVCVDDKVVGTSKDVVHCGGEMQCAFSSPKFAGEVKHLKQLAINGKPLRDPYLDFGPSKLTRRDVWCLIPPQELPTSQLKAIKKEDPRFKPGWLTDNVRKFSPNCFVQPVLAFK
jgi:hypothetical protein